MTNTSLENELLSAIDNIRFTEFEAMVESTNALLEMYDKQLDIIEETTVPDEMLVTEFAIFKEADESDSKDDKKEDGWLKRTFNTRFGDSAPENQKLFGRTNKEGKKEHIVLSLLALVPRLIVGLVNLIVDKIKGKSKEEAKDIKEKAGAAAEAVEKGSAEVKTGDGKVRVVSGDLQHIEISLDIFERISALSAIDPTDYDGGDANDHKRHHILVDVKDLANIHSEAFGKIKTFINDNKKYMQSQYGDTRKADYEKQAKAVQEEIDRLTTKRATLNSGSSEHTKISDEITNLEKKLDDLNKAKPNFDTHESGKGNNKKTVFNGSYGSDYADKTKEDVKKALGGGFEKKLHELKNSTLLSTIKYNNQEVKGLNSLIAVTDQFVKNANGSKNKKGEPTKENVVAVIRFVEKANDETVMNQFSEVNMSDLNSVKNVTDVSDIAYDPQFTALIKTYSNSVKAFVKTATNIFNAELAAEKSFLSRKGGVLDEKGNVKGERQSDVERYADMERDFKTLTNGGYEEETEGNSGSKTFKKKQESEFKAYEALKKQHSVTNDVFIGQLASDVDNEVSNKVKENYKKNFNGEEISKDTLINWIKLLCDDSTYTKRISNAMAYHKDHSNNTGDTQYKGLCNIIAANVASSVRKIHEANKIGYKPELDKLMAKLEDKAHNKNWTTVDEIKKDNNAEMWYNGIGDKYFNDHKDDTDASGNNKYPTLKNI